MVAPPMAMTETRTYYARTEAEATIVMQRDAQMGAGYGYQPVQSTWKGPNYLPVLVFPIVAFIVAWVFTTLFIALIVAVLLGGLVAVLSWPKGRLTVTFARQY
jgi:hypothetical protein